MTPEPPCPSPQSMVAVWSPGACWGLSSWNVASSTLFRAWRSGVWIAAAVPCRGPPGVGRRHRHGDEIAPFFLIGVGGLGVFFIPHVELTAAKRHQGAVRTLAVAPVDRRREAGGVVHVLVPQGRDGHVGQRFLLAGR